MMTEINDVLFFIKNCTEEEELIVLEKIKQCFVSNIKTIIATTVLDELKIQILKEAFDKYTLEELEKRLK